MRNSGIAGCRGLALASLLAGTMMMCGAAEAGGLYLRAGVGLDRPGGTAFTDRDCSSASPAALYGCGRGGDGAPLRSVGDFAAAPTLELGLGYAASSALRLEVVAEYRPRLDFEGRANFLEPRRRQSVEVELSSLTAMLAAYLDLAEAGLPGLGPLAPFVGAGAGVVSTRAGATRMTFPRTTTLVPGARRSGFAWMFEAGVSAALGGRATLDLAWRYTDLGEVRTGRGAGQVIWRDASREPLPLDLAETWSRLTCHGLRLSIRYAF
ncbi:MAG: outer membrane beta-barrel protein [Alphaproteobacteria bacterium]|nr:outer membrane beta-barrel protein [Alphaproteobacteria bacterium]